MEKRELVPSKEDEKIVMRVAKVQQKVNLAVNSYRDIMADVHYLNKNKVHKLYGYTDFYVFMKEKTGMSKPTAARLVSLYQSRLDMLSTLSIEAGMTEEEEKRVQDYLDAQPISRLEDFKKDESSTIEKLAKGMETGNFEDQFKEVDATTDSVKESDLPCKQAKKAVVFDGTIVLSKLVDFCAEYGVDLDKKYEIKIMEVN